jgi:hypothetical protein
MWYEMQKVGIEAGFYTSKTAFCGSTSVHEGLEMVRRTGAKSIVSIGSTSIADTAKGIQALVGCGAKTIDEMDKKAARPATSFPHFSFATEVSPEYAVGSWLALHNQEDVLIRRAGLAPAAVLTDVDTLLSMSASHDWSPAAGVSNVVAHLFDSLFTLYLDEACSDSGSSSSGSSGGVATERRMAMLREIAESEECRDGLAALRELLHQLSAGDGEFTGSAAGAGSAAGTGSGSNSSSSSGGVRASGSNKGPGSSSSCSAAVISQLSLAARAAAHIAHKGPITGGAIGLTETAALVGGLHRLQQHGQRLPQGWVKAEAVAEALVLVEEGEGGVCWSVV